MENYTPLEIKYHDRQSPRNKSNFLFSYKFDILYIGSLKDIVRVVDYAAKSLLPDVFSKIRRRGLARKIVRKLLKNYVEGRRCKGFVKLLGAFKNLKEIVLVRELGNEYELEVNQDLPLQVVRFEDEVSTVDEEEDFHYTDSDTVSDTGADCGDMDEDIQEAQLNDPMTIAQLWERALEMGEDLKAFKDVKLTFLHAKRHHTPPFSEKLEEYYWDSLLGPRRHRDYKQR
jgi:hypothetical protein